MSKHKYILGSNLSLDSCVRHWNFCFS